MPPRRRTGPCPGRHPAHTGGRPAAGHLARQRHCRTAGPGQPAARQAVPAQPGRHALQHRVVGIDPAAAGNPHQLTGQQAQALLVSVLVVGVGGVSLWRAVVHAILTNRPAPSGWLVGLWLGIGIAAGELLGPGAVDNGWLPAQPEALLVLVAALVLVMTWTAQSAEWWAKSWPGRSLRPAMLMGLAAASLAFGCVLYWWYDQGSTLVSGWPYSMAGLVRLYGLPWLPVGHISVALIIFQVVDILPGYDATAGSLWWAVSLLWLLPLLVLAMRPLTRCPAWLTRAKPGTNAPLARQLPRLGHVWGAGLSGGLVSCVGLAVVMARMHSSFIAADRSLTTHLSYLTLVGQLAWPVLVICGVMALTSAAVAAATDSAWLLAGLIAAGITAVLGVVTDFLLGSVNSCLGPVSFLTTGCRWLPNVWTQIQEGLPLPLTVGVLVVGLAAFAGRGARLLWLLWPRPDRAGQNASARDTPRPSNREVRLLAARITVVALIAAVATLTVVGIAPSGGAVTAAQLQAAESAVNPASPPSASVTRLQILAWGGLDGAKLLNGFSPAESAYGAAFAAAGNATTNAQFATALRELSTSCEMIAQATQRAAAYFDVPDPTGQQLWSHMLTRYRHWTAACRRLGPHTTVADIKAATTANKNAVSSREAMVNWLNERLAMYLGRVKK